jgi:ribonuclease R
LSPLSGPFDRARAERAILAYLGRSDYRPIPLRELLHRLHAPREARPLVRVLVKELLREGKLVRQRGDRLAAAPSSDEVRGLLERHRDGYGFVIPEDGGPDVFIPPRGLGRAFHGDQVVARVIQRRGGRSEGLIVDLLERRSRRVFGVFRARDGGGTVLPYDAGGGGPISVPGSFRMGAGDGEAVEVEVLRPPLPGRPAEGKVLEVLGRPEAPGVDAEIVARKHGLALEFPGDVLEEAARLPAAVPEAEAGSRERFDDPEPVTIDGETARDFDDAVSVSELPDGGFRLFVHVADVGHFVVPGSTLDQEAKERGTSVYFPDRVLPMFPERLSNDLCSLRPGEDRLVQSVVMELDSEGRLRKTRFADGMIRSAARLTYTQVAELLEGRRRPAGVPARLVPMLRVADRLRRKLEERRRARGSVDFDLPEPTILLDVEGVMTGIAVRERNPAHRMVEEFMLLANEAVAGYLDGRNAPCLYRIHERPDPEKMEALATFVSGFGLSFPGDQDAVQPDDLRRLLEAAEGRPEYPVVAQVALRSMKQARYSPENIGHFGLAAPIYCHFTSPIRRYPDLVVHRLLRACRWKRLDRLQRLGDDLERLGEDCSRRERNAESAERELLEWKKIAFMRGREGETFEGIVTGVAAFGLFVQLSETLVEGLLRVERLGRDRYTFHEKRLELRGAGTGRAYRIGDRLRVAVDRVDAVLRRVDLSPEAVEEAHQGVSRKAAASRPARSRTPAGRTKGKEGGGRGPRAAGGSRAGRRPRK